MLTEYEFHQVEMPSDQGNLTAIRVDCKYEGMPTREGVAFIIEPDSARPQLVLTCCLALTEVWDILGLYHQGLYDRKEG